ncbi:MAG TPA: hypothetical protein VM581_02030 [Magnetospirillaceae bacterium]|nr:hypothetical protein [Magnetospirillaceae bacterium]
MYELSTFDKIRIAVGGFLALAGVGVLVYVWATTGFTDLNLAGYGVLFIVVGGVIAMSSKDGHLADEIFNFFNVLK